MKKTTCKNLGGACNTEITGETPEEMGQNSRRHVKEKVQSGDKEHITAIKSMQQLSQSDQAQWYEEFKRIFNLLPEA